MQSVPKQNHKKVESCFIFLQIYRTKAYKACSQCTFCRFMQYKHFVTWQICLLTMCPHYIVKKTTIWDALFFAQCIFCCKFVECKCYFWEKGLRLVQMGAFKVTQSAECVVLHCKSITTGYCSNNTTTNTATAALMNI